MAESENMDHCAVWESTYSAINFLITGIFEFTFWADRPFYPQDPRAVKVDTTYHFLNVRKEHE